jgi:nucleoid-associated protein YgaU
MTTSKARLAAPFGAGASGELQRLTITSERGGEPVKALFNPSELSSSRSLEWEEPRRSLHGGGDHEGRARFRYVAAETLSIELLFDTYEQRSFGGAMAIGSRQRRAADVRQHTDRLARLAEIVPDLHRPPICALQWGSFDVFRGVLSSLAQRFTMFLEDGTPVRATLDCTFLESATLGRGRAGELHSADVTKTRQVRRNDTLHSIAAEEYNDPALWRHIATANGIVDPLRVRPGTVLTIPRLR